jgi:AcrR family transcriptional regulator
MKTNSSDRRAQRTARLVTGALASLMAERRYDAITVQDILDRADVGRSTFYTHYYGKEDVLATSLEGVLDALSRHLAHEPAQGRHVIPSLALFCHVQENYHLYEALARSRGAEVMFARCEAYISRAIEAHLGRALGAEQPLQVPPPLVAGYVAGAFTQFLRRWLEARMPYTPEQMDKAFRQLALPGLRQAMGEAFDRVAW